MHYVSLVLHHFSLHNIWSFRFVRMEKKHLNRLFRCECDAFLIWLIAKVGWNAPRCGRQITQFNSTQHKSAPHRNAHATHIFLFAHIFPLINFLSQWSDRISVVMTIAITRKHAFYDEFLDVFAFNYTMLAHSFTWWDIYTERSAFDMHQIAWQTQLFSFIRKLFLFIFIWMFAHWNSIGCSAMNLIESSMNARRPS